MKSSYLNSLFLGSSRATNLSALLDEEVYAYAKLLEKKGATVPIYFNEDEDVVIDQKAVRILLLETMKRYLTNIHLAYLCDCLTLGNKVVFETEAIEDVIFAIADPEINGGFLSNDEIQTLLENLEESSLDDA